MKTRFPSILGVFAAILMVASFVVPMNVAAPSAVSADPGIMKWDTVSTPSSVSGMNDILNDHYITSPFTAQGSSINGMAVGNDGMTLVFIDRTWLGFQPNAAVVVADAPQTVSTVGQSSLTSSATWAAAIGANGAYFSGLYYSNTAGIAATITRNLSLVRAVNFPGGANLYQIAIAPDDPKVFIVTSDIGATNAGVQATTGPVNIWITTDGGNNWDLAFAGYNNTTTAYTLAAGESIRCIDISADYGGKRDIAFGTAIASGAGRWFVRSSSGFTTWTQQIDATAGGVNYYALKFSPTYSGDSSVALVYANAAGGTYYNVAFRDLNLNTTGNFAFADPGIMLWNISDSAKLSPVISQLRNVSLQLPSDFSGQSASLRRAYVSLDTNTATNCASGIYRVDDTTVYVLMDTSTTTGASSGKTIYSIAYFGTYASGKLLAGERFGYPCSATVPTWFTDSPTTCPIPCWYPALKPTTGAANTACSVGSHAGLGAAIVGWNADGSLGLVSTGSEPANVVGANPGATSWFYLSLGLPIGNDESAFGISRNNGETWNQLVLINTSIDWFNDVAVAPDCTTIYLASALRGLGTHTGICNEFDSVWRSTINPNVAAPLPAIPPLGTYWERVYTRVTAYDCRGTQTDLPILRVVPSCTDKKDGEIVGWAAQNAVTTGNAGVMAWSPDYGDYWAPITPRFAVQDFAFESSTTLYVINGFGMVQRLPYTGTSWSTNLPTYQTNLETAHTIVAVPDGKVLAGSGALSSYPVAYSADKGVTWTTGTQSISGHRNMHVIFDVDFKNNNFIYVGDDAVTTAMGTVYRNTVPSFQRWTDNDMMSAANGNGSALGVEYYTLVRGPATGYGYMLPPHNIGIYGLVQAWTGDPQPALYAAHDNYTYNPLSGAAAVSNSAVCRTLKPRSGMPKPGILWDCLDIFAPLSTTGIKFTLEPTSLKYCGCCTLDTNTTLYAIDNQVGGHFWNSSVPPAAIGQPNWPGYVPGIRRGMLWAYTDCLAKKGPILKTPADKFLVGADPVSGRNQQIDLSWEQLCLSTWYQLQIAKDIDFTMRINPAMNWAQNGGQGIIRAVTGSILLEMDATNMTSPAAWIAPGSLPEAGAIYFWRIRSAKSATQQLAISPWSEVRSFTVKAGFIVNTPYYGVQLLAPNNGCLGCKVKPASFSWSPWKEATKYQFDLATDPEFKSLVVTATTTTTGYEYSGTLNYSTNYFWRVKALEVNGQNIPSDWSATFSLQTEPAPAPPAPPPAEPATPLWVWVIIAIGAILVIVTLILIFKTRRV